MRCPAIEGIETDSLGHGPDGHARERVECVAPLSRGLKLPFANDRIVCFRFFVECVAPLSRGLKRGPIHRGTRCGLGLRRMRCPAIEGIETISVPLPHAAAQLAYVECVAPLSRGLKLVIGDSIAEDSGTLRRMRCPAIEGIETGWPVSAASCADAGTSNALPRYRGD